MMWRLLLAIAVIPGAFLAAMIYRMDKYEHEPPALIAKLLLFGAISVIPTIAVELALESVYGAFFEGLAFLIVENMLGVALVEEGFKYLFLKLGSWKHKAFDYQFDGVVYAVSVSIGFAVVENIMYVGMDGFATGILRAVTAVPGHTIFGIFMGYYYGMAKYFDYRGETKLVKKYKKMAIVVPMLIHGIYDIVASLESGMACLLFFVGIFSLEFYTYKRVKKLAAADREIA